MDMQKKRKGWRERSEGKIEEKDRVLKWI